MQVRCQGQEDPLEEGMATGSTILAWRIPWTEEPGRLQSMGLQRVGHNCSDLACMRVASKKSNNTSQFVHTCKLPTIWGQKEKETLCKPGRILTRTWPYWHPDLRLLAPRTVRKYVSVKLPALWYFFVLTQAKTLWFVDRFLYQFQCVLSFSEGEGHGGQSPYQQEILVTSAGCPVTQLILTPSSWRCHQIPQVKGLAPRDLPHCRCQSQIQVLASASDPLAISQRFPKTSPQVRLIC